MWNITNINTNRLTWENEWEKPRVEINTLQKNKTKSVKLNQIEEIEKKQKRKYTII